MWFVYLDESKDSNRFFVYSALIVDSNQWSNAFRELTLLVETRRLVV